MNNLPITNIEKFKKINDADFVDFSFSEAIYITRNDTYHVNFKVCNYSETIVEGIIISWKGNPFNLNYIDDNYIRKLK